jgi:hypothetical protein
MVRHVVATLAYRGGKTLRGVSDQVAGFRIKEGTRTPGEILAHVGDLLDWALSLADGGKTWHSSAPQTWERDVARFFDGLQRLDDRLASDRPLGCPVERLFQGPIADALTHIGQIALLRRLAGAPLRGENYYVAEIAAGRVGLEQAAPHFEFD